MKAKSEECVYSCQDRGTVKEKPRKDFCSKNYKRYYVQHNYHDHSKEAPCRTGNRVTKESRDACPVTVDLEYSSRFVMPDSKGRVLSRFPRKLHELLETIDEDGPAGVISWQPHGRSFLIHKAEEFITTVMPQHFRQTKLSSFHRQLNLYGFLRITQGRDKGAYYHELFLRGKSFLVDRIKRQKVKGTMIKSAASPETEPDFYSMTFVSRNFYPSAIILSPSEDVSCLDSSKIPRASSPWAIPVSPVVAETNYKTKASAQTSMSASLVDKTNSDEVSFYSQSDAFFLDEWVLDDDLQLVDPLCENLQDYSFYEDAEGVMPQDIVT